MDANYTAIVQQRGEWWIGWIEEIPGVNSQAATRDDLIVDLQSALPEALEMNRADALAAAEGASFEKMCRARRSEAERRQQYEAHNGRIRARKGGGRIEA